MNEIMFFSRMCSLCGEPLHYGERCVLTRKARPLRGTAKRQQGEDRKWFGAAPTRAGRKQWRREGAF